MQSDIDGLVATAKELRAYLERNTTLSEQSDYGITSAFWQRIFAERSNLPDINGLIAFRRGDYVYGIGDERQESESAALGYFDRISCIMRYSVPGEFVRAIREPLFAAPYVFEYGGCVRSANFLVNAATAWHVSEQIRKAGLQHKALDFCEIGSGWGGCAYQLHQALRIRSCTLIDLPENLLLSATYLLHSLQNRKLETVDVTGEPLGLPEEGALRVALPGGADRLQGPFDFVLNSFSLQEMEKSTVERYLSWVQERLAPDGIFVSINSHGKAGVKAPRDYGFERFEIRHLSAFRTYPTGFFNTIPYAMTLKIRTNDSPRYSPDILDALCGLMQLGLREQIQEYADKFANGVLTDGDVAWLLACSRFLRSHGDRARLETLDDLRSRGPKTIADYLEAHLRLAQGEHKQAYLLLVGIATNLDGFALMRAGVIAAVLGFPWDRVSGIDAVRMYPELGPLIDRHDVGPLTRHFESVLASIA